jgi:uncharacterized protein YhhL (DUF1145 family)
VTFEDFWPVRPLVFLLPNFYFIWISNLLTLIVPDSKNGPCALNLISTFLMIIKQERILFRAIFLSKKQKKTKQKKRQKEKKKKRKQFH